MELHSSVLPPTSPLALHPYDDRRRNHQLDSSRDPSLLRLASDLAQHRPIYLTGSVDVELVATPQGTSKDPLCSLSHDWFLPPMHIGLTSSDAVVQRVITCAESYQLNIRRELPETILDQYHRPETTHRTEGSANTSRYCLRQGTMLYA